MRHLGLAAVAIVVLVVGLGISLVESQANQPWGQTLGDNFMLARSLPFTVGLGVALGYARAHWPRKEESGHRFARSTVWLHWLATLAVLLGLATGAWQYLQWREGYRRTARPHRPWRVPARAGGGGMSPRFTKAPPQTGLPETESSVLKSQLTKLGLHSMAATFEAEADRAAKSETSFTAYLGRLVELELADKADRSINARIARARFPVLRRLEQFDFSFQPSLSAARVRELASLTFLDQATNVSFVGGPGVGKTHLAIALAVHACTARRSVLFTHAPDLLDQLLAADASHTLGKVLDQLRRLDLLVVDELGYLPMDGRRANLFFQLVAARYPRLAAHHQQCAV